MAAFKPTFRAAASTGLFHCSVVGRLTGRSGLFPSRLSTFARLSLSRPVHTRLHQVRGPRYAESPGCVYHGGV